VVNANRKGKGGEHEAGKLVCKHLGGEYRRTPNSGGLNVKSDIRFYGNALEGWHVEVKRQERWSLPKWIRQARRDAGAKPWLIPFRRNDECWYICMEAEDFLVLVAELQEAEDGRDTD